MIYAYIRVSTDKQTVENQRFEIERFCEQRGMKIDKWVSETVSGTKAAHARRLGALLKKMKKGDTLICSEISRLGRRLMEVMSIHAGVWLQQGRYLPQVEVQCQDVGRTFEKDGSLAVFLCAFLRKVGGNPYLCPYQELSG